MRLRFLPVFLFILLANGCRSVQTNDDALSARILVWHSWTSEEAEVLEEALLDFQEIHPEVGIISASIPPGDLLSQFRQSAANGLGPDLLLGSSEWIQELAKAGLIRPLDEEDVGDHSLESGLLSTTIYQNIAYGIPLSLGPQALYYNKTLVDQPATTLDEFLKQAAEGNEVAFVPRFVEAYWGIQAFGDGLFDRRGNFTLAGSGFTEWLEWLSAAQNEPGVILNVDGDALLELFVQGSVVYTIAGPGEQTILKDKMGDHAFGVTPLPAGPAGPAGPLLPAESLLLYTFSSNDQARVATTLAQFLANQQQSIRFMRDLDHVPANPRVSVDPRIYETVSGFAKQAETAVILPSELDRNQLYATGDRAYASVLSGLLTPEEAVCRFGQEVADLLAGTGKTVTLPLGCTISELDPAS